MLRAKPPEAVQKRLKMFVFGDAGGGKSTGAIQFPRSYIIDAERGTENYDKLINASQSAVIQTTDMQEVVTEIKSLLTEPHEYRTLVIDPITPLYDDLLEKCALQVGTDFGRHYGAANTQMKRLANLIMALDLNVIMTAHAKTEYGEGLVKVGKTFDGWKRLDYLFDLVIELQRKGKQRIARVVKTRIETFPDGDQFEWSYDAIRDRYGAATMERAAKAVEMARPEQVEELKELLSVIRLPEGMVEKWLAKSGAESLEDMKADDIGKCIAYCRNRLPNGEKKKELSIDEAMGGRGIAEAMKIAN